MVSDPVVKEAFEYYKTMWDEGLMPEGAEGRGRLDLADHVRVRQHRHPAPWWRLGHPGRHENNPDLDFGVTALPGKEAGQTSSFAGGDGSPCPSAAQDVDAAWEFIEWTLSDDVQTEIYAKNGAFTSRTDLADNEYAAADPRIRGQQPGAHQQRRRPRRWATTRSSTTTTARGLAALQSAIFGGDVDGALQTANDAIQSILDSYYQ